MNEFVPGRCSNSKKKTHKCVRRTREDTRTITRREMVVELVSYVLPIYIVLFHCLLRSNTILLIRKVGTYILHVYINVYLNNNGSAQR